MLFRGVSKNNLQEMDVPNKAINSIVNSIDWRKIKSFHKKLNITWEFEIDKEIVERVPNVGELKEDLRKMLEHMYNEKLTYISYGNWVIFWENQEDTKIGDIRIVFRLADFVFESSNTRERLETALNQAIENENYEYAAKLRDEINKEKQTNGK
jgi:hypothetical protein